MKSRDPVYLKGILPLSKRGLNLSFNLVIWQKYFSGAIFKYFPIKCTGSDSVLTDYYIFIESCGSSALYMLDQVRSEPTLFDNSNQKTDALVRKLGLEKIVYISSSFVDLHLYAMNSTITLTYPLGYLEYYISLSCSSYSDRPLLSRPTQQHTWRL